jgi:hypothetical protein
MANEYPVEIDGTSGEISDLPTRSPRYRCKLETMADVKREMAKVYRESRSGVIDAVVGTKLIWMLQAVGKAIETGDLEKRIELLEASK